MNAQVITLNEHRVRCCAACVRNRRCVGAYLPPEHAPEELGYSVSTKVLHPGEHLYFSGDTCDSLFVLRSGHAKTVVVDENGEEQVTAFCHPGDALGLDGLAYGRHIGEAIALDTLSVCVLPLEEIARTNRQQPELHSLLPRLLSQHIVDADHHLLVVNRLNAMQRLAAFLLAQSQASRRNACSATRFTLAMSRTDIANHLNLALETVSRLLSRLKKNGVIRINRNDVEWLDLARLESISRDSDDNRPGNAQCPQ